MKKFVVHILITALPLIVLFCGVSVCHRNGVFFGDVSLFNGKAYDITYRGFYLYDPGIEKHVVVTDNYPAVACDSSVLVVGDSFSQLGSRSFTQYLQKYLPNWTVFDIQTAFDHAKNDWRYIHQSVMTDEPKRLMFPSMMDVVDYLLENSAVLPNTIVIESTEMFLADRMKSERLGLTDDSLSVYVNDGIVTEVVDMGEGVYSLGYNGSFYDELSLDIKNFRRWVKVSVGMGRRELKMPLKMDCFTCKGEDRNLYHSLFSFYKYTPEQLLKVIENQKRLIALAEEKGVNLIFFICPDKMHLYNKYATAITPEQSCPCILHDMLPFVKDDVHFQLNNELLQGYIERGEKDIYICTDTHWSYKAADITAKELSNRILNINNIN